jgi:hypothetical protein
LLVNFSLDGITQIVKCLVTAQGVEKVREI